MQHSAAVAALLAGAGLLGAPARAQSGWNKSAFGGQSVAEVMKALGASQPVASAEVSLQALDYVENGVLVAVEAATTLPGARRLALLVEKNPHTLAAVFELSDAIEPKVGIQLKLAQTSNVYAVVLTADGRALYAHKQIHVTLGGCAA